MARHAQVTQNKKLGIFLQYLKKEASDKVGFLHADNIFACMKACCKLIQWFWQMVKHPQSSQNSKFATCLQYLKKEVRGSWFFAHADKHQSFLQVDFNTLAIKVSYSVILSLLIGMIKHSQSTQIKKLAIFIQHLKKEVRNGVHFLQADKPQRFFKFALSFLMEVARHAESTQNKLITFLQ